MTRTAFLAACVGLAAALAGGAAAGPQKGDKGEKGEKGNKGGQIPGIRWKHEVTKKGQTLEEGVFRAEGKGSGKLWVKANEIGTWTQTGKGEFDPKVTGGKLKGSEIHIKQTGGDPPKYNGDIKMADGMEAKIKLDFVKD